MVTEIVTHNSRIDEYFDTQLPLLVPSRSLVTRMLAEPLVVALQVRAL